MGFEKMEHLEDSMIKQKNKLSSLKKIKTSPKEETIHIDPPHNFFEELTPDLLNSCLLPGGNYMNTSIRDNESLMYFFDIKQPVNNKSLKVPKYVSSQVLSPSRGFDKKKSEILNQEISQRLNSQNPSLFPEILNVKDGSNFNMSNKKDKLKNSIYKKNSPDNMFWNKNITSPTKIFNQKGFYFIFLTKTFYLFLFSIKNSNIKVFHRILKCNPSLKTLTNLPKKVLLFLIQ